MLIIFPALFAAAVPVGVSSASGALLVSGDDGLTLTAANTAGITMNSTAGTMTLNSTGQTVDLTAEVFDLKGGANSVLNVTEGELLLKTTT